MPLSFQSENHGTIAFGFFNIESDMLLLENIFFFAADFCAWMTEMAQEADDAGGEFEYPAYRIPDPADIGDLMGAIHGVRFTGFIGDVYKLFPFPAEPEAFKQNPEGHQTREQVASLIKQRAVETAFVITCKKEGPVCLGPFVFSAENFGELIRYVWRGGYPRWKGEVRPEYVLEMRAALEQSSRPCFKNIFEKK